MQHLLDLALLLFACAIFSIIHVAVVDSAKPAPDLPDSIYALSDNNPKPTGDSDLVPLDNIISDAHGIALSEAMHTSGGIHEPNARKKNREHNDINTIAN